MPQRVSAQSGLSTDTSTWVGGVVPVVGDDVVIAAVHTVTMAGAHHWGNDTATAITVNGVLRASRTVSSQLTCRGELIINTGGSLDYGTEADPIPQGVTATIIINDSAAPANNKWQLSTATTGAGFAGIRFWGHNKTAVARLVAPSISTSNVLRVDDASGWSIGDFVAIQVPTGSGLTFRAITGITVISGTVADVTIGASTGLAQSIGHRVLNLTRNVRLLSASGGSYKANASIRIPTATTVADAIELGPMECNVGGNGASAWQQAALNIYYENNTTTVKAVKKIDGPVFHGIQSIAGSVVTYTPNNVQGIGFFNGQAAPCRADRYIVALPTLGASNGLSLLSGASVESGPDCLIAGCAFAIRPAYGQGPVACRYYGDIVGATALFATGNGVQMYLNDADIEGLSLIGSPTAGGEIVFDGCRFGQQSELGGTPGHSWVVPAGALWPIKMINPSLTANFGVSRTLSNFSGAHPDNSLTLLQINGDPSRNERYNRGGRIHRDGTRTRRSTGSICLASWYAANALSMPLSAKVLPGVTMRIKGAVWIEASYLPGDAPSISLSAAGLTAVNWSAPAVADQWNEFDLQIVNTNSYPTDVVITLTARSDANSETARVWFDGIFADPWSGEVRHHGFQWQARTALIADPRITLTEAAALALPVVVDHDAGTITVTGPITAREGFEANMADLVQTANQSRAVHITSATGDSFETTYTVITSGAGVIAGAYEDATGRHVTISAPALIAGSRVQVYDLTSATELYNGVLSTTGLLLPVTWTADHTIRLRAEHADKLALQTLGVLGSAGLSFLDVQADDDVYLTNGIDGSTCTEFTADGANVEVDISDPDGVTSVQRLYAWAQWYQTTATGIASDFFGAIEAVDAATYLIDQAKADITLDNVGTLPVRVIGGYLARRDGHTVIASTSGSIQMDPGKAYLAGADGLARESTVQTVLGMTLPLSLG